LWVVKVRTGSDSDWSDIQNRIFAFLVTACLSLFADPVAIAPGSDSVDPLPEPRRL